MSISSTFRKWLSRRPVRNNLSQARPARLRMESLEVRDVPAGVIGFGAAAFSTPENVGAYTITVTRTGAVEGDLNSAASVSYSVVDGTAVLGVDYSRLGRTGAPGQALSGTLNFGADAVATTQTATISVNIVETRIANSTPRTFNVGLSNVTGVDETLGTATTSVGITSVAPGLPVITSVVPSVANNNVIITVARQGGSFGTLNVPFQTLDGSATAGIDYTTTTGTLSWADSITTPQTITVPVLSYATLTGSKTFSIDLGKTGIPSPSAFWSFDTADNLNTNPDIGVITDLSGNGNNLVNNTRQLGTTTRGSYGNHMGIGAPFERSFTDGSTVSDFVSGAPNLGGQALDLNSGLTYLYTQGNLTAATWNSGGESVEITSADDTGTGTTVTVTTSVPNTFVVGQKVRIFGLTNAAYNKTTPVVITSIINNTQFTFENTTSGNGLSSSSSILDPAKAYSSSVGISAATMTGTTVTITTSSPISGLTVGSPVIIAGLTPNGYNGTFIIDSVISSTQFTYTNTNNPQDKNGTQRASDVGIFRVSQDAVSGVVSFRANTPHRFESGQTIVVSGFTGAEAGYNGTYTLTGAGGAPNDYNFTGSYVGIPLGLPIVGGDGTSGTTGSALLTLPAATVFGDVNNAASFGNVTYTIDQAHNLQNFSTARIGGGTSTGSSNPGVGNSTTWSLGAIPNAYGNQSLMTVVNVNNTTQFTAIGTQTNVNTTYPGRYLAGGNLNDGGFGQGPTWDGPETFLIGGDTNGFMKPITSTDTKIYVQSTLGFPSQAPFHIQLGFNEKVKVVGIADGTGVFTGYKQYTVVRYPSGNLVFPGLGSNASAGQTFPATHTAKTPVILVMTPATSTASSIYAPINGNGAYQTLLQPFNTDAPFTIAALPTISGNSVSFNLSAAANPVHTFIIGQNVTIAGFTAADAPLNGSFVVSNIVGNTITVTNNNASLPAVASSFAGTTLQGINGNLPQQLAGLQSSSATPYVHPKLNSLGSMGALADNGAGGGGNNTSTSSGTMTYNFWLNVPEINGAPNGSSEKYRNADVMILSHQSDMGGGVQGWGQVLMGPVPGQAPTTGNYTLKFRADGRPDGSPNQLKIATSLSFGLNTWNMFTLMWKPEGLDIYQNGVYQETLASMGTYNPTAAQQVIDAINGRFRVNNTVQTGIAANQGGNVIMDDLALWQQTLTPAQIQAIYQKGVKGAWQNQATVTIGSDTAGVTSNVITSQPSSVNINSGGTANFTVATSNGFGTDTVQWQVSKYNYTNDTYSSFDNVTDGGVYTGATSGTLTVSGNPTSSILSASSSGNTATVVTTGTHSFVVGDLVTISGIRNVVNGVDNPGYNGTFVITGVTTTNVANDTFTYFAVSGLTPATSVNDATAKNTLSGYRYQAVVTNGSTNGPTTLISNSAVLGVDFATAFVQPTDSGNPGAFPINRLRTVTAFGQNVALYTTSTDATGVNTQIWQKSVDGGFTYSNVPASETASTLASATQPMLVFTSVQAPNLGLYRSSVTNAQGTYTSNSVTVTNSAITITTAPTNQTGPVGGSVTFTAAATAVAAGDQVSWQQSVDGGTTWTLFSGPTSITTGSATLTINNLTLAQNGYQYRAAFANGTLLTSPATLTVFAPPVISTLTPSFGGVAGSAVNAVTITGTGFTGVTAVSFGATPSVSFQFVNDTTIVATAPAGSGTVDVSVTVASGTSANTAADDYTYVAALTAIKLDGVDVTAPVQQRSTVRSITLDFNAPVAAVTTFAAAITVTDNSGVAIPGLSLAITSTGNSLTIAFTDANVGDETGPVRFNSLADGRYRLSVNGSQLTHGGVAIDADGNGTAGGIRTYNFHRFFGDTDGDESVGLADLIGLQAAFGGENGALDFDNDGSVGLSDLLKVQENFGQSL